MKKCCLFVVFALCGISVSYGQRGSCNDYVDLPRGKVKVRSKGRVAKFSCRKDSRLLGSELATCIRGQWFFSNGVRPVCISPGCASPQPPSNGFVQLDFDGALARFRCGPGYRIAKEAQNVLYCDGYDWNGTSPLCQAASTSTEVPTSCDFEEDFCSWQQDTVHHIDWERRKLATPSAHIGTGPSFDHTFGETGTGYYVYVETSGARAENDTSRLFSPVYKAELSKGACFVFWYHMLGATMGTLNVYVRPESKQLAKTAPTFQKSGNQGNQWLKGVLPIPELNENFQIVIEALRGTSYVSDIGIDDLKLAKDEECLDPATTLETITTKPTISPFLSCNGKCGMTPITPEGNSCSCGPSCLQAASCCLDYTTYCLANNGSDPTMTSTVERLASTTSERPTSSATASSLASMPDTTSEGVTMTTTPMPTTTSSVLPVTASEAPSTTTLSSTPPTISDSTTVNTKTTLLTSAKESNEIITIYSASAADVSTTESLTTTSTSKTALTSTVKSTTVPDLTSKLTTLSTAKQSLVPITTAPTTVKPPRSTNTPKFTSSVTTVNKVYTTTEQTIPLVGDFAVTDNSYPSTNPISSQGLHDTIETTDLLGSNIIIVTSVLGLTGCATIAVILTVLRRKRVSEERQAQLPEDSDVRYLNGDEEIQLDLSEQETKNKRGSIAFGFEKF